MYFWWLVHSIYLLWWWFLLLLSCVLFALTRVVGGVGGYGWGNKNWACCSVVLMVFDTCLYVVRNSFGVNMVMLFLFWICVSVIMSYVYSLSRFLWDCDLELSVRLAYAGLVLHANSNEVLLMGNALFVVLMCILYYLSSRKIVSCYGWP